MHDLLSPSLSLSVSTYSLYAIFSGKWFANLPQTLTDPFLEAPSFHLHVVLCLRLVVLCLCISFTTLLLFSLYRRLPDGRLQHASTTAACL
jgi:hypothetical protein